MSEETRIISTDAPLSAAQRETLAAVADTLIPPSADGRMPGAGRFDVATFIVAHEPAALETIAAELARVDAQADAAFAALDAAGRLHLLTTLREAEPGFMSRLAALTAACYYQQDEVLEAIGMPARAPFPEGYEVDPGDLGLLEPVAARGRIYRDAGD